MAVNFGSAIARGLVKGLGEGYSKHLEDQRRERLDAKRLNDTFNMFQKQIKFRMGMEDIQKQNEALGKWEEVAKLSPQEIVQRGLLKASEVFSPQDRPKFVRDGAKQLDGMEKSALMVHFGYVKPDYSQYVDKPEYQDAIPRKRLAGIADMPDMESTFKYDPRTYAEEQKKKGEKMTDYMRKKEDEFKAINSIGVMNFGKTLSDEVKNFIWKNRPEGVSVEMKGSEAVSYDQNLLTSLVNNGQVVPVGSELKFVGELTEDEQQLFGMGAAPQEAPQEAEAPAPLYTEPKTQEFIQKQEAEKVDKAVKQMSKDLGTGKGTPLTTYTELNDAMSELDTMSDDALDYLFTVGWSNDTVRDLRAKFGDEDAQKAKNLISKMSGTVNSLRHELFGSALTEGEAKAWKQQFADIGVFNNKENLKTQLGHLIEKAQLGVAEKMAGYTPEQRQAFLERNPSYAGVMSKVELGENGQVSDSAAQLRKEAEAYVDELIASGQYDESQREGIINHLINTATQSIE